MRFTILLLLACALTACKQDAQKENEEEVRLKAPEIVQDLNALSPGIAFATMTERAHNKNLWEQKPAVSFNIDLSFGGKQRLNGKITSLTDSEKIRLDKKDGSKMVYDGEQAFICPPDADYDSARFDLFTWQYFFAMPFKLTDPGTKWELMEPQEIQGKLYNRAKLTFEDNIGDSPDDWYVVYQDPVTKFLRAAAYIVTYNKEREQAEQNPHAILYHEFRETEGIPIAARWSFHNWSKEEGIGEMLGEAVISDVIFFDPEDELFEEPVNSKLLKKPD